MIEHERRPGVPRFTEEAFREKRSTAVLLIPIINEGGRILHELARAQAAHVPDEVDLVLCDGGSTDGSTETAKLRALGVRALLTKQDSGRQGAQLRMGIAWALSQDYAEILTIDGNDKDSIEDVPRLRQTLASGYDFVQGSRFVRGGHAIHTPWLRYVAVRLIHAPIISLTARHWFTDTTNNFRGYSAAYLRDPRVAPLRDVFEGYELLAYLSVRATQIGRRATEVPVTRRYPKIGKTPTKISAWQGNKELLCVLLKNFCGAYAPRGNDHNL